MVNQGQEITSGILQREMGPWARFCLLLIVVGMQLLYVPINRTVQGGVILDLPLDAHVPFWPIWAVPYLLSLVFWNGCFVWAAWKMEDGLYRALVAAALVVMLSSYAVYVLFPTYVERPALAGDGWPVALVRLIYNNDRLNNAFPSGHTYHTMLIVFFWWRWQPQLRWLWVLVAVIILLSTLFTGQHNVLDLAGGIVWAWAGYRFGLWWANRGVRVRGADARL